MEKNCKILNITQEVELQSRIALTIRERWVIINGFTLSPAAASVGGHHEFPLHCFIKGH